MGLVYLQECDLDGSALLDVHRDGDGDIWIVTTGDGSVMLEPESARKLAEHLLSLPGVAASGATTCPGHGRPECATCCWPASGYTAVDMTTAAADGYRDGRMWNDASEPPDGVKGCWSRPVTVFTNMGNSLSCSYFHGDEGGVWQHPKAMQPGETIISWTEHPEPRP